MKSLKEALNSDVQGSIRNWYKDFWKERLQIQRRMRYIKKALKRYKISQSELAGLGMNEAFQEGSKYPLYDTLQEMFEDIIAMINYCKRHNFKDLVADLDQLNKEIAELQHKTEEL